MHRSQQIELDPTDRQVTRMSMHTGYGRVAYNYAIDMFKEARSRGERLTEMDIRRMFNAEKRELYPWCVDHSQNPAKNAIRNFGDAIRNWGGWKKDGTPRKTKNGFPKHKKKGVRDSYQADNGPGTIRVDGNLVRLPRIGWIRMCEYLRFDGEIVSCTVRRIADRWFVSLCVDTKIAPPPKREITDDTILGVDLGVKTLAMCSDGVEYENPRPLHLALRKLARLQCQLSRKRRMQKGKKRSNRYVTLRVKIARLHYRISCLRKDTLHKITTAIVKRSSVIGVESLNVKGMMRNRKLARAISDAGWGEFIRQLRYKCELYGVHLVEVDRWFPSSKLCSGCGWKNEHLTLSDREWTCGGCGMIHDRDMNAAINIRNAARSAVAGCLGRGDHRRPAPCEMAMINEASTQPMTV